MTMERSLPSYPAATIENVSAHSLVHQAPTKIRVGNPLAKHVPVVLTRIWKGNPLAKHVPFVNTKNKVGKLLAKIVPVVFTALLAHPVVHILQLLVLLEPMPVEQQPCVIFAVLDNTMIKQVKRLNQLLVQVAMWENTKTKREKHSATTIV